jgi:hypothetical protein
MLPVPSSAEEAITVSEAEGSQEVKRRVLLVLSALLALPVLATYLALALDALFRTLRVDLSGAVGWVYFWGNMPYYQAARWVLRYPLVYLASSALAALFAMAALCVRPRAWRRCPLPVLLVRALAAFPLAYRYRPALTAAPGYRAIVLTPISFPQSVARAARVAIEVRSCEYLLLGWSEGELYYQQVCGDNVQRWAYDPDLNTAPWKVTDLPAEWDHSVLPRAELLKRVRAANVWPAAQEPLTRNVVLAGDGLVCHDNHWTACIGTRPEGEQDVLVVEALER